ncbi:MAG: PaaX domain-containing protein, C- domain protein [Actinobacteria bacterium]|nr:PaaX domain-containing protein, C- domain protein [Actinomycetota bacterium]
MATETPTRARLTARSVLASTLLGVRPPELPTRSLVATARLLGVSEGSARTAISRMVAAGELEATDGGYRLAGSALLTRQTRQDLSRTGVDGPWDGTWRTVVVTAEARPAADRVELRAALAALRFAELREGIWLRPDNLPAGVLPDAERTVRAQCRALSARPLDDGPAELAAELWPLDAWATTARALHEELSVMDDRLVAGDTDALSEGFVVAAHALRHFQADPLLPPVLLPDDWPGPALRAVYEAYDRRFKETLATWQRGVRTSVG